MFKAVTLSGLMLAALYVGGAVALSADGDEGVRLEITEWDVPFDGGRARDPWVDAEGRVWFVGQQTHYVGRFTPESGEFERFPLEDGTGPHTVITNEQGVWYAGNRAAHIGLLDPASGAIETFVPPGDGRRDVHSMAFDGDDNLWFTEQGGNRIGHFDPRRRAFTMHEVSRAWARPYGIVVHDDQPWIALFGTHRLATVKGGEVQEIDLPRAEARPRRLDVASDGGVWYGDYATGHIGRYDPDSGEVKEWPAPSGARSLPYAVVMDGEDRFWIVETGVRPNRFVAFDTREETWTEAFEIPSGGGTVRHMVYDPARDAIWFGTDENTLGRAALK
ncbi:virginiamycin B lyase family protein [Halomonas stenophila]|uniref:Virginiamycin B lyase n=1 Tax=Halomonas stenophila TaxID=795312 RepID=A0A7W5HJH5_9GAMM|nr:lyase [Halomonas stenophila]MBB3230875.1 virginiamycin B lyase [Halomonas stenophila]